ncbi:MAG: hypothetical protein CMM01_23045 [Rhodopirellula sp.]|nr:hypothetical protein [Rhodopirellula sp.]
MLANPCTPESNLAQGPVLTNQFINLTPSKAAQFHVPHQNFELRLILTRGNVQALSRRNCQIGGVAKTLKKHDTNNAY